MNEEPLYDRVGQTYSYGRHEEPRIAACLQAALEGAETVLNVGAGTGSYEPANRTVVAVEPSMVMASQRPDGAAAVIQAVAESLPFGDRAFDAAMAVLTIHHWHDLERGLLEVQRVAGRLVFFVRDPVASPDWWLYDYFPATKRLVASRETPLSRLQSVLGRPLSAQRVPIPALCRDGFEAAYWRRPEAFLDARVCAGMSALALTGAEDIAEGQQLLAADLKTGEWNRRYGELFHMSELDLGYRVVVAEP